MYVRHTALTLASYQSHTLVDALAIVFDFSLSHPEELTSHWDATQLRRLRLRDAVTCVYISRLKPNEGGCLHPRHGCRQKAELAEPAHVAVHVGGG